MKGHLHNFRCEKNNWFFEIIFLKVSLNNQNRCQNLIGDVLLKFNLLKAFLIYIKPYKQKNIFKNPSFNSMKNQMWLHNSLWFRQMKKKSNYQ